MHRFLVRALGTVAYAVVVLGAPLPAAGLPAAGAPEPSGAGWSLPLGEGAETTRPFQRPPGPYAAGHRGVDLSGPAGSPVLAAGDGVVVFAGMVAGRPVVSIDHVGGLRTTYEPVDASVGAGRRVTRGSPIGALSPGHAGCPREACLHWGVRRGEAYLDPMELLRGRRVRLLPLQADDAG